MPTTRGLSLSPMDMTTTDFLGPRLLIEKLLRRMGEGGTIAIILSIIGALWSSSTRTIMKLVGTQGFDEGRGWLEANKDDPQAIGETLEMLRPYAFSKECLTVYAKVRAFELAVKNIRIKTISPGMVETPLTKDFRRESFGEATINSILPPHGRPATPEEAAQPLVFLNSAMASYISGQDLQIDYGFSAGMVSFGMSANPVAKS